MTDRDRNRRSTTRTGSFIAVLATLAILPVCSGARAQTPAAPEARGRLAPDAASKPSADDDATAIAKKIENPIGDPYY